MAAQTPALGLSALVMVTVPRFGAYKTPIPNSAQSNSFFFLAILSFHIISTGKIANAKSRKAK